MGIYALAAPRLSILSKAPAGTWSVLASLFPYKQEIHHDQASHRRSSTCSATILD